MQLAIVAAFAGASSMAQAALTLPATSAKIAQEYPTVGGLNLTKSSAPNISSATTSFSPSTGQNLQVTVGLAGGATFTASPSMHCNFVSGLTKTAVTGTKNYGGAGLSTAIFTIGATTVSAAGAKPTQAVTGCTVTMNGITTVTGAHATVNASMTYQYGTIASSVKSGAYISWVKGASAGIVSIGSTAAQVSGNFVNLKDGNKIRAGAVYYNGRGNSVTAMRLAGTSFTNVTANITGASLTVQGAALSAVTATHGVWLSTTPANCTNVNITAGSSVANNSITFKGLTPAQVSAGLAVCLQFTGKTAIPTGSITATWTLDPVKNYSADGSMASNTLVDITHNGTTLVAPLVQTPTGFMSRMVLTNTGPAATYTVTATSETGNTATLSGAAASGTIAANSTTVVDLPGLVTYTSGQPSRTSLTVNIAGLTSNIKGLYQIVDPAGAVSNYVMVAQ